MTARRSPSSSGAGLRLLAWAAWLAATIAGLVYGPSRLAERLSGLAVATSVMWLSARFAVAWRHRAEAGDREASEPDVRERRPVRPSPGHLGRSATEQAMALVRLAMRSPHFFETSLSAYLGSLSLGRPLEPFEMWSTQNAASAKGREAFWEALGEPGPHPSCLAPSGDRIAGLDRLRALWRRRDRLGPTELERFIERVEKAYENRRRAPKL